MPILIGLADCPCARPGPSAGRAPPSASAPPTWPRRRSAARLETCAPGGRPRPAPSFALIRATSWKNACVGGSPPRGVYSQGLDDASRARLGYALAVAEPGEPACEVVLRNGGRVRVRAIRPDDAPPRRALRPARPGHR